VEVSTVARVATNRQLRLPATSRLRADTAEGGGLSIAAKAGRGSGQDAERPDRVAWTQLL